MEQPDPIEAENPALILKPKASINDMILVALLAGAFKGIVMGFLSAFLLVAISIPLQFFVKMPTISFFPIAIGAGLAGWIVAALGHALKEFRQYTKLAPQMEYQFYADHYQYTIGDGTWITVPYSRVEAVSFKESNPKQLNGPGIITLTIRPTTPEESIPMAMRKIINIPYVKEQSWTIQRLLDQNQGQ